MTDVSNLDELANAIASSSTKIKAYARAQAQATQSQEAELRDLAARVAVLENQPDPEPSPPGLPFAEAVLSNPIPPNIPVTVRTFNCLTGNDYLIDLGKTPRAGLQITGSPRRVQIRNGHIRVTDPMSTGPFARGGLRLLLKAEHVSVTDLFVESTPTLTDAMSVAGLPTTKFTLQRSRLEGAIDSTEPAEHCDAFQVQAPVGGLEFGLVTAWAPGVRGPNDGGKCFQIAHEAPSGWGTPRAFRADFKQVNMVGVGQGQARFGTPFIRGPQGSYGLITETLEDVWIRSEGNSVGDFPGWFAVYSATPGIVSGSAPNRRIDFDPAKHGITGFIREGGTDFVTRAMLGV